MGLRAGWGGPEAGRADNLYTFWAAPHEPPYEWRIPTNARGLHEPKLGVARPQPCCWTTR